MLRYRLHPSPDLCAHIAASHSSHNILSTLASRRLSHTRPACQNPFSYEAATTEVPTSYVGTSRFINLSAAGLSASKVLTERLFRWQTSGREAYMSGPGEGPSTTPVTPQPTKAAPNAAMPSKVRHSVCDNPIATAFPRTSRR